MKQNGLLLLVFMLFLLIGMTPDTVCSAEASATLQEVVSALEKGYGSLQDVQADFSQRTKIVSIGREQKGAGEVLLKKPASATAMFRFNYTKPKQQIVSNGKQVWFYLAESKQVMISSVTEMFKGGNSIALSYLTGLGHVSRDFNVAFSPDPQDSKGNYQLELTPNKPTPVLSKLQLTVTAEAVSRFKKDGEVKDLFPVVASVVHDAAGNQTRIEYSHVKVNKGLGAGKFNFKIPEGVEVVKP